MRIVKQNRFKNLGELHKEWTEAGVKASRATTHLESHIQYNLQQLFNCALVKRAHCSLIINYTHHKPLLGKYNLCHIF